MLSHDYKYRQASTQKSCSTIGQKQGSVNQMVKITVESAVIMKPGYRMIHRSQEKNPQVSYTYIGKKKRKKTKPSPRLQLP